MAEILLTLATLTEFPLPPMAKFKFKVTKGEVITGVERGITFMEQLGVDANHHPSREMMP